MVGAATQIKYSCSAEYHLKDCFNFQLTHSAVHNLTFLENGQVSTTKRFDLYNL